MIYRIPEIIDKKALFYQILPDLTEKYRNLKKGEDTAVSFVQVNRINSNALPLFMGMLNLLQNKSGNPVYLELAYNPRFLAFLDTVGFFDELSRYDIIEYDEDYVGGLSDYHYNKNNKVSAYVPIKDYEDKSSDEKQDVRDNLAQKIRGELSHSAMLKEAVKYDELWDVTLTTCTELIVNAIIHSGSISYTYMQSNIAFSNRKNGYLLSIVDVGKGFYASLSEKIKNNDGYTQEDRKSFYTNVQNMGIDATENLNFLSIMEALSYSQTKAREMDLYKLKNKLAVFNANFRIHQKNTEVVFTASKCYGCLSRDILCCVKCIWDSRIIRCPSVRTYPVAMAGVHVEVEFVQEK